MRMKSLLPRLALVGALGFGDAASAQQSGTADEAKALLARAAVAVQANQAGALAKFDDPRGGFKDHDLYVFCFDRKSGMVLAGQAMTKGKDVRSFIDPTGSKFGQQMFANARDGDIIIVDYEFPRPGSIAPVPKESFVEGLGDIACGVGYYRVSTQAPGDSPRMARVQHACAVVMGLHQPGSLYLACVRSLDRTLSSQDQARQAGALRSLCAQQKLTPGTPSFAACVETGAGF